MRSRNVGTSELVVSVVGLGGNNFGWRLDAEGTRAVVDAALDAGITLFDTAESYGGGKSEEHLGRALAGRRERAVIATKFGWGRGFGDTSVARGSRQYIRGAIEGSLARLQCVSSDDGAVRVGIRHVVGVARVVERVGATPGAVDELVEDDEVAGMDVG